LRAVRTGAEPGRTQARTTTPSESAQFSFDFDAPPVHVQPASRAITYAAFSAAGMEREAEEVAVRIRRLIDGGVRPERIAVAARQARPAIDHVCAALGRVRVPATARQRIGAAEIPVVRGVLTLFAAAADGWTRHGLVELAEQPYLRLDLDATVLNHIGYRRRVTGLDAWQTALDTLLRDALAAEQSQQEEDEQGIRR